MSEVRARIVDIKSGEATHTDWMGSPIRFGPTTITIKVERGSLGRIDPDRPIYLFQEDDDE